MATDCSRILLVEDDPRVSASLTKGLAEAGYDPVHAPSAEAALKVLATPFDLVLLDLGLPGRDGLDVVRELRHRGGTTPVLILTARDGLNDRVKGLDAGADDYLVKPFAFAELLARVRALLRRHQPASEATRLRLADLEVDLVNRTAQRGGTTLALTLREFDLLAYFMRNAGQPVTRDMLARNVWKETARATPLDNVIDVHLSHLRTKIDRDHQIKLLHTIRGVGFILELRA